MSGVKPFEKATDETRVVTRDIQVGHPPFGLLSYVTVVIGEQRKWIVQDGPAGHAIQCPPPEDRPWIPLPGQPLCWVAIKPEWRDVPAVRLENLEEAARTQLAVDKAVKQISTNA